MKNYSYFITCCFSMLLLLNLSFVAKAQEVSVELGQNQIGLQEMFTITATVSNDRLEKVTGF